MRRLLLIALVAACAAISLGQGATDYLRLRRANGITQPTSFSALGTMVGVRVVELQGTVKGSFRVDDKGALMLSRDDGGTQVAAQTIRVNQPLRYGDITFYQSFFGPAMEVTATDASGTVVHEGGVPLRFGTNDGLDRAGFFTLPADEEYLMERLSVYGFTEDAETWDLEADLRAAEKARHVGLAEEIARGVAIVAARDADQIFAALGSRVGGLRRSRRQDQCRGGRDDRGGPSLLRIQHCPPSMWRQSLDDDEAVNR